MDAEIEQLLKTEQEIQELLRELQALKKQVGGYSNARESLEEARQSLHLLVEKTSTLAEQTHAATMMLGKIGTPEILARADSTRLAITEFAAESAKGAKSARNVAFAGLLFSVLSLLVSLGILVILFRR